MAQQSLNRLHETLEYEFKREELLARALTHSSLAYEQGQETRQSRGNGFRGPLGQDNEQLEFLGDAVLGLVIAEILFRRFPEMHEGELTRLRASLVSRRHMARVATNLDLGNYLRLGRGEERSGGRKKSTLLANSLEALIAALYLDGGLAPAEHFIQKQIAAPYLDKLREALDSGVSLGDHKSALQELLQARSIAPPKYVLKAEKGPSHRKRFLVELRISASAERPGVVARGIGNTKKIAEQEAARRAFEKLRRRERAQSPAAPAEGGGS
jgi:ribonuclease III